MPAAAIGPKGGSRNLVKGGAEGTDEEGSHQRPNPCSTAPLWVPMCTCLVRLLRAEAAIWNHDLVFKPPGTGLAATSCRYQVGDTHALGCQCIFYCKPARHPAPVGGWVHLELEKVRGESLIFKVIVQSRLCPTCRSFGRARPSCDQSQLIVPFDVLCRHLALCGHMMLQVLHVLFFPICEPWLP